jgi:hypothetical protein
MKCLKKFVKNRDIHGNDFTFNKHKNTLAGGLLTIIMYLLMFFSFVYSLHKAFVEVHISSKMSNAGIINNEKLKYDYTSYKDKNISGQLSWNADWKDIGEFSKYYRPYIMYFNGTHTVKEATICSPNPVFKSLCKFNFSLNSVASLKSLNFLAIGFDSCYNILRDRTNIQDVKDCDSKFEDFHQNYKEKLPDIYFQCWFDFPNFRVEDDGSIKPINKEYAWNFRVIPNLFQTFIMIRSVFNVKWDYYGKDCNATYVNFDSLKHCEFCDKIYWSLSEVRPYESQVYFGLETNPPG